MRLEGKWEGWGWMRIAEEEVEVEIEAMLLNRAEVEVFDEGSVRAEEGFSGLSNVERIGSSSADIVFLLRGPERR